VELPRTESSAHLPTNFDRASELCDDVLEKARCPGTNFPVLKAEIAESSVIQTPNTQLLPPFDPDGCGPNTIVDLSALSLSILPASLMSSGIGSTLFWLNTLCVPAYARADIGKMIKAYEKAVGVLVLGPGRRLLLLKHA
jgi:hypothetical protein